MATASMTRFQPGEVVLLAPSVIRVHKLATVAKSSVTRRIGELPEADQAAFWSLFRRVYCQLGAG